MTNTETKTIVNLPDRMVIMALRLAEAQARRAKQAAIAKYGPEHMLVQTLGDEEAAYAAATAVQRG